MTNVIAQKDPSQFSSVHVVVGNESCDLDSAICSVTYAFYLNQIRKEKTTLVVPVLNIPASHYRIHTEIVHVFRKIGVQSDCLVFLDQIDLAALAASGQLKLTLVDHNLPTGQLTSLDDAVVSVIDHHVRERPENDRVTVKLDFVGSCSTLVAEELLNDPDFEIDKTVAELLLGTILIDTVNRLPDAGKITPRDTAVLERLQNVVPGVNGDQLYAEIQAAKLDMSDLSNMEVLEKDLKMVSGTDMTIAMSSVAMEIQELLGRPGFQTDLEQFCGNKMADVAIVMTMTTDGEGQPARQMAVFSTNRIYRDQIADVLDNSQDLDLDLEPVLTSFENVAVFHQGNVAASRKLVMPVLGSFLHGDRTPEVHSKEFVSDSSVSIETEGFTSFSNIKDQDITEVTESYETSQNSAPNKMVSSVDFLNSDNESFCQSFGAQVIEEDSNDPASSANVKKANQTLPSGEKSSANSSNLFDFLTSGSSELMDPFSSVEENTSTIEISSNIVGIQDDVVDTAEMSSAVGSDSAIATDTNSPDPFNMISIDSNETADVQTQLNPPQDVGDLAEFDHLQSTDSNANVDLSGADETLTDADPFGLFNTTAEPTNSNNNPFTVQHSNSNPFESNDSFMNSFSSDKDPFGTNDDFVSNFVPFRPNDNFSSPQQSFLDSQAQIEGVSENLLSNNPFGQNFPNILTPYNSTEDTEGATNSSINPFQLNVSVVEPSNIFPDPFGSLQPETSPILESPEDQSENELLSTVRQGGARAKARKSISLIVEVDKESDNEALGELDESDFYDRVPTPERDRSGSDSPFINPNFTSPSGRYRTRTSDSSSGFPSVTTPPNSVIETSLDSTSHDHDLPSFNSAEMVERIRKKKQSLHGGEDLLGSEIDLMSTPYTPQNSFRDDFERKSHDLDLLTLDNESMSARIQEKRDSLGVFSPVDIPQSNMGDALGAGKTDNAALLDFGDIPEDSSVLTVASVPMVPTNSFVGTPGDYMSKHALEGFELHDKLAQLHDIQDNDADDDEMIMLDFSTKVGNKADLTETDKLQHTDTSDPFGMEFLNNGSEKQTETDNTNDINGLMLSLDESKSANLTELESSVRDVAAENYSTELTQDIIDEAVEKFPDMENTALAECVAVEMLVEDNSNWTDQGSGDSGIASNDSNQQARPRSPLRSPLRSPRSPRRTLGNDNLFSVETEYLPSMDPLHGNLNIVTSPSSSSQTIETDADKEVVESESFRRISGQEKEPLSDVTRVTPLDGDLMSEQGRELLPGPQPPSEAEPAERGAEIQNMIMEENLLTSKPSTESLPDQKKEKGMAAEETYSAAPFVDLFNQDIEKDSESMIDSSPEASYIIEKLHDGISDNPDLIVPGSEESNLIHEQSEDSNLIHEQNEVSNLIHEQNEDSNLIHEQNEDSNLIHEQNEDSNLIPESVITPNKVDDLEAIMSENLDIENGNVQTDEDAKDHMSSMDASGVRSDAIEVVPAGETTLSNSNMSGFYEVNPEFRQAAEAFDETFTNGENTEETDSEPENIVEIGNKLSTVEELEEVNEVVANSSDQDERAPTGALSSGSQMCATDDKSEVNGVDDNAPRIPQTIEITGTDGVTTTVTGSIDTNSISPDSSSSFISTSDSESELITVRENLVSEKTKGVPGIETVKCDDYDSLQHKDESNSNSIQNESSNLDHDISGNIPDDQDQNTYTSYDVSNVDDIFMTFGENPDEKSEMSGMNEDVTLSGSNAASTLPDSDISKVDALNLIDVSMTESTVTVETISPVETPNDEHATGFYEVNPEMREPFDMPVSDMNESQFDTNLGENVTGFYEINPDVNDLMVQSTDTTESASPAVTPSDEHASGFYEISGENDSKENENEMYIIQDTEKESMETGELKSTTTVADVEKMAPEINVDDFDNQDSDQSDDSSNDGETGFYDMNAKIQGTMLQNIEIGNSFSPIESPNDEIIDINPMVQENDIEQVSATVTEIINDTVAKDGEDTDHEEQLLALADTMVTDAISGALDSVQELHMQKHEQFIVSEISNAMVDDEDHDGMYAGHDESFNASNSMTSDSGAAAEGGFTTVLDDVHEGIGSMVHDDSSDSDTSSTTTEGSYRIPHSQDDSPLMSPENESFMKKQNEVLHEIEPILEIQSNTELSSNDDGFVPDLTEGSQSSEVFEEIVFKETGDDSDDPLKIKDKDGSIKEGNQDAVFSNKVVELEHGIIVEEDNVKDKMSVNVSDIDIANGNLVEVEIPAEEIGSTTTESENVKPDGNYFSFDQAAESDVDKDSVTAVEGETVETIDADKYSEMNITDDSNIIEESSVKLESSVDEEKDKVEKEVTDVVDKTVINETLAQDVSEYNENENKELEVSGSGDKTGIVVDTEQQEAVDTETTGVDTKSGDKKSEDTKSGDTKSGDTKSRDTTEYVTRKEIFYTSAGRMSISIDSVVDKQVAGEQEVTSQDIIHEATEIPTIGPILARAESVVGHVDDMLNEETIARLRQLHNLHKSSCTELDTISLTSQPPDDDDEEEDDVKPVEEVKTPETQTVVKPSSQSNSHGKMKAMEDTQEWHEDPIPGMAAQEDESESESDSDSDSEYTKPVRPDSLPGSKRKKKITANSNMIRNDSTDDLVEGVDDLPTPDDLETPDDMEGEELEWEDDTPITPIETKKFTEYRQVVEDEEEDRDQQENGQYRKVEIAGKDYRVDMHVIEPYKKVLSHGGYYGDGLNAIILFCGCYLPDRGRRDYQYVMDNLFLYVISTLELLVAEDYMIVYFHGATPRRQMPSFGWLKRCYQMIDRRLRKNLKALLMVHPTLWLKTVVMMTKPFISSKFSSKLRFVKTLQELSKIVPMEYIYVPDPVTQYDTRLKQHRSSSSSSTPISPTSPS